MTNEQILELAEKYFDYQGGWIADTKDLLKFALAIHEDGYNEGYTKGFKVGHDAGWELNDEVSHRGL